MKKRFLFIVIFLICFAALPALANGWGLKGDLLSAVMASNKWNAYTSIGEQAEDFAVLGSRYHNVLMRVKNGELLTYPLAVYQPGHPLADKVRLMKQGDALTIVCGKEESFTFQADGLMTEAHTGSLSFRWADGVYLADETIVWQRSVHLSDFNIQLFPRTIAEVTNLNHLYAALDSGVEELSPGAPCSNVGKGTVPVYSAPFGSSAWRAADGKAAVGLAGEHWQLGDYLNADGEAYTKIRYEVSERTQRIGFVRTADLNAAPNGNHMDELISVNVEATNATYLTDDPLVSQYHQFEVPAGTQFICMGTYGLDYAYVSAEVRNGRFVDGGAIVWGFVPLRDLRLMEKAVEWNAMAEFAGEWLFTAGGNQAEDVLILNADGTYRGYPYTRYGTQPETFSQGTWRLTQYNGQSKLYWTDPPYEITLINEDGPVTVKGFLPTKTGFSLLFWEGSGGYERLRETFVPPVEGHG